MNSDLAIYTATSVWNQTVVAAVRKRILREAGASKTVAQLLWHRDYKALPRWARLYVRRLAAELRGASAPSAPNALNPL